MSTRRPQADRQIEALRELTTATPDLSPEAQRLAESLAHPARPNTVEEARAVGAHAAIDISGLIDDTISLPFPPPLYVRHFLGRVPVPTRRKAGAKSRLIMELTHRSAYRRRAAALALGSWPADPELDQALARLLRDLGDPFASAMASCSLASHRASSVADALDLADRASSERWDPDALVLALLGAAASIAISGTAADAHRLRRLLREPVADPELAAAKQELDDALSSRIS